MAARALIERVEVYPASTPGGQPRLAMPGHSSAPFRAGGVGDEHEKGPDTDQRRACPVLWFGKREMRGQDSAYAEQRCDKVFGFRYLAPPFSPSNAEAWPCQVMGYGHEPLIRATPTDDREAAWLPANPAQRQIQLRQPNQPGERRREANPCLPRPDCPSSKASGQVRRVANGGSGPSDAAAAGQRAAPG